MTKRVAIIGGGPLGVDLARKLETKMEVMLIEPRSHYLHVPATVRTVVDPTLLDRALIPYDGLLKHGRLIRQRAVAVDGVRVTLADGSQISTDFTVIATGSRYAYPFKAHNGDIDTFRARVTQIHARLQAAKRIAIVGSGSVGIELAGEIRHALPEKDIFLIGNQSRLFPELPKKFGEGLHKKLTAMGVTLRLGVRAESLTNLSEPHDGPVRLSDGTTLEVDLVFPALGAQAEPELLTTLPNVAFSAANRVKVDPWLRPSSLEHVFAGGDVAETGDGMTIVSISRQVPWLAKTLLWAAAGKPIGSRQPYRPRNKPPLVVPLGPKRGSAYVGLVFGDRFTSMIKGKDLFLTKRNKLFGRE